MSNDGDAWVAYIEAAVDKAGSVAALARRAGLNPATIFRWRSGQTADGALRSIHAVADAIGDDRRNALRAAGRLAEGPSDRSDPSPTDPAVPALADEIARIRAIGDRLGLPPDETLRAISQLIEAYERLLPPPRRDDASEDQRRPA